MSSQQPSAVDLLVSSEVSRVSDGGKHRLITQAVKSAEIEKALRELRSGRMIVIAEDNWKSQCQPLQTRDRDW